MEQILELLLNKLHVITVNIFCLIILPLLAIILLTRKIVINVKDKIILLNVKGEKHVKPS